MPKISIDTAVISYSGGQTTLQKDERGYFEGQAEIAELRFAYEICIATMKLLEALSTFIEVFKVRFIRSGEARPEIRFEAIFKLKGMDWGWPILFGVGKYDGSTCKHGMTAEATAKLWADKIKKDLTSALKGAAVELSRIKAHFPSHLLKNFES